MRNSAEIRQLVADARAGNFNAVIVEVRKRGDAYYNSSFEPKAADVFPQAFDPLADLVAMAHNTSNGPRIEVHAWIVTYNIWNNETTLPPQATHPYRLHRDWVTRSSGGTTWDGWNYAFDPGHPEVQKHTFNVAMDIVSRYDVDGLHFDYIRYAGNTWGYNDVAVNRFKARYNRPGAPSATDPQWLQFRRDQVTSLLRKIYLSAIAVKPLIKISAATITWAPGITTDTQWLSSAAYSSVLQDWRAWMQEGILDVNVPMVYFRRPINGIDWANWSTFAKNHRYNRHLSLGSGTYLNSVSDALAQMRSTRTATSTGNRADGVTGYSYAVTSNDGVRRSTFFSALTHPSAYDPNPTPIFSTPTTTPEMSWKTAPTLGHLKGIVNRAATAAGIDGAGLALNGAVNRALLTDATGFYGAVDLPPGNYTLTASFTKLEPKTVQVAITAGAVANQDFNLTVQLDAGFFSHLSVSPEARGATVSWTTAVPTMTQAEFGTSTNYGRATHLDENLTTNHSMLLTDLLPNTNYYFRLVARTETNELRSGSFFFPTAGRAIVDNPVSDRPDALASPRRTSTGR